MRGVILGVIYCSVYLFIYLFSLLCTFLVILRLQVRNIEKRLTKPLRTFILS
jgi:hypothetical protein